MTAIPCFVEFRMRASINGKRRESQLKPFKWATLHLNT
jgi:hypothetical protein